MRFATPDAWLRWLEGLHPKPIDLGLERVAAVWQAMSVDWPDVPVVTVAGTNGKGSSVAFLEAIYRAAGYSVCAYTSPHLHRYHERMRLDGRLVNDAELCAAFDRVDQARGEISLSYFEFGTLAALDLFAGWQPDIILLEVGLGGRLDAVNIIDADISLISSIDLDHQAWLGSDIDQIAREKAGVMRPGRPTVFNGDKPPAGLVEVAEDIGARLYLRDRDYRYTLDAQGLSWSTSGRVYAELPLPSLQGKHQRDNAAAVLMVVRLLQARLPVTQEAIAEGLLRALVPGRFQHVAGVPDIYLDVAHNPQGARALAETLRQLPQRGRLMAVFGVLDDKDLGNILRPLYGLVDAWFVARPNCPRGRAAQEVAQTLGQIGCTPVQVCVNVSEAFAAAKQAAHPADRLLVFGSFFSVSEVMSLL